MQQRPFDLILGLWQSLFDILIANTNGASDVYKACHFWETVIKTVRSIYVNFFNTLRFLAEFSTKLQKLHFLDNLRTITQERNTELDKWHHFLSNFAAITVCNIQFYIWKWSKFIFLWYHLWSILVCKIPQF